MLFAVCTVLWSLLQSTSAHLSEDDATLRTPEIITKYGYPFESHQVVTSDGYILTHHRIPSNSTKKAPIILHHGLLGSSAYWILRQPKSLGFMLSDAGYDVWLLNNRGNEYCERHSHYNPQRDRRSFWNFSWHEIGVHDLPETIDYILNVTGSKSLYHLGHSQGTTVLLVMLSERPEYNSKVKMHIGYAPVAYHKHTTSFMFRALAPIEAVGGLSALKLFLGEFNFAPSTEMLRQLVSSSCKDNDKTQFLCSNIFYMTMGFNPKQMNTSMLPTIYGHFPVGSSTKQLAHYIQEMNSGRFRKFDYYLFENLKRYSQISPPDYKLDNVKIPFYDFHGGKDALAQPPDVLRLHGNLPNLKKSFYIPDWAHMDFIYGIDAEKEIYSKTFDILNGLI
ncbi:PREDICTED: lipase 3-like [Nicrophorus vespilloides]|uniref:Lipase n=1 Tax=Nicrophorus vespilloides TaxID=110193 RepID=A0ABM1N6H2_NICVS|nr:PREDICTED: lipase 3-like [Nicrophorus vespilloides]